MPNFGFSAFLKLVCSNPKPQARQVSQRLTPSTGGYDYHRSLKQRVQKYLLSGDDFRSVLASTKEIIQAPERNSAIAGLNKLHEWRSKNPGVISVGEPRSYQSPSGEFSVIYTPSFIISQDGRTTAFHIWNNMSPALTKTPVYGALSLFQSKETNELREAIDLGVLSLRDLNEYKLSDVPDHVEIGDQMARGIDRLFLKTRSELAASDERTERAPADRPRPLI